MLQGQEMQEAIRQDLYAVNARDICLVAERLSSTIYLCVRKVGLENNLMPVGRNFLFNQDFGFSDAMAMAAIW